MAQWNLRIHYSTLLGIGRKKMDPKNIVSKLNKLKCIDYIEKWPFMVIFLYNLYIFVWIQYSCLANMDFAWYLSDSVIKR